MPYSVFLGLDQPDSGKKNYRQKVIVLQFSAI